MTTATNESLSSERLSVVLVRTADLLCALPLTSVIETLRCPPLVAVSGAPECVAGVAMVRGATVAVIDLGLLLGSERVAIQEARLLTLRVGRRIVGLAVNSVIGVRDIDRAAWAEVPPLLRQAHPEVLIAVGSLDRELLLLLDGTRILTEEIMGRLEA
jgi:purine-binding chemotaxis protein CheW